MDLRRKGNWREGRLAGDILDLLGSLLRSRYCRMNVTLRPGKPEDVKVCATICYEAFQQDFRGAQFRSRHTVR